MTKFLFAFLIICVAGCNNNGDTSSSEKDTNVTNISGVENVNGNMPDTTNSITVDGSSQSSDPAKDSTKKN